MNSNRKAPGQVLYLSQGSFEGKDTWHYLLVDKLKLPQLIAAAKQGQIDLSQYGRILFSGFGKKPPQDIVLYVQRRYG